MAEIHIMPLVDTGNIIAMGTVEQFDYKSNYVLLFDKVTIPIKDLEPVNEVYIREDIDGDMKLLIAKSKNYETKIDAEYFRVFVNIIRAITDYKAKDIMDIMVATRFYITGSNYRGLHLLVMVLETSVRAYIGVVAPILVGD